MIGTVISETGTPHRFASIARAMCVDILDNDNRIIDHQAAMPPSVIRIKAQPGEPHC
jgi:hypothetical protein